MKVPPLFSVEIAPPLTPDPAIAARVRAGQTRYTTPAELADRMAHDSLMRFEEEYERPRGTGPLAAPAPTPLPPVSPQGVAPPLKDAAGSPAGSLAAAATGTPRRKARWQTRDGDDSEEARKAQVFGSLQVKRP